MRLGTSINSTYSVDDPRTGAARMIERARAASESGLDSLFVGDHHSVGVPYYQNSPILGRLLAEWRGPLFGALYLLPLWHPVLLAEQIGTLASLHDGRFVIQCALGGGAAQFEAMGASLRTRPSSFERNLDVVRRLLAGEAVDSAGPPAIRGAVVSPRPPEPVEVWIGASATPAIDRAARLGDAFIAGPEATPDDAAELADRYRQACDANGRPAGRIVLRRDVHVGADRADARRVAEPVLAAGYRGFDPAATVVGGVTEVADGLSRFAEMGYTDILVRHLSPDQAEVLASFDRLGEVRASLADV